MVSGKGKGRDGRNDFKKLQLYLPMGVSSIPGSYLEVPSRLMPNKQLWRWIVTLHGYGTLRNSRSGWSIFSLLCQKFLGAVGMHTISHQLPNPQPVSEVRDALVAVAAAGDSWLSVGWIWLEAWLTQNCERCRRVIFWELSLVGFVFIKWLYLSSYILLKRNLMFNLLYFKFLYYRLYWGKLENNRRTAKTIKSTCNHTIENLLPNLCVDVFLSLHTHVDINFLIQLSFFSCYEILWSLRSWINRDWFIHLNIISFIGCVVLGAVNAPRFTYANSCGWTWALFPRYHY